MSARRAIGALLVAAAVGSAPALEATEGPLWGKRWAAGSEFPLAFGIGLKLEEQRQELGVDSISLPLPGVPPSELAGLPVDGRQRELDLKLDAWLLPYLNVFVVAGRIDGRTVLDLGELPTPPVPPAPLGRVTLAWDGEVYGGGATLRWSSERAFASLTGLWTEASLSGDLDSDVERRSLAPRLGLHDGRGAVWLGAAWQSTDERHAGALGVPFVGSLPFAVELSGDGEWSGLVGIQAALDTRWHLELEGGFGARETAAVAVTYRF